ncbi:hypothetical protein ABE65_007240 [Fictibacillus phosphorivorans]|uniref:Uncharacterized protein n=1 Tax=Fictibacillus phosphorivorans TaxID=1221500 RepID=A0A160IMC9_9BACL|nr:hypothetical protein ABE65_007240 [Fictibacillus phosphorivorans]
MRDSWGTSVSGETLKGAKWQGAHRTPPGKRASGTEIKSLSMHRRKKIGLTDPSYPVIITIKIIF